MKCQSRTPEADGQLNGIGFKMMTGQYWEEPFLKSSHFPRLSLHVDSDTHLEHLPGGGERQNGDTDQEIGYGQTDDKEVGDAAQFVRPEDGRDDQAVAHDDEDIDDGQNGQRDQRSHICPSHIANELIAFRLIHLSSIRICGGEGVSGGYQMAEGGCYQPGACTG